METLKVSYRIIWIGENNFTIFLAPPRERERERVKYRASFEELISEKKFIGFLP
ncbi:MAG: hypothetical protein HUU44_11455 [Ignavibacteriaceae bacterium]|nr:hypothetical protein [Ignavibacteriaceae bacterium]